MDRINYTLGMKVPGPEAYSSVSFSVSLTSDVKENETIQEAMDRVKDFVETEVEKDFDEYQR